MDYKSDTIDMTLYRLHKSMEADIDELDAEIRVCAVGYYDKLASFVFNFLIEVFPLYF